jgi:hypothetical protein
MGVMLCKIHGRSEIAFACPHIQDLVGNKLKVKDFLELKFDLADTGIAIPYNFCLTCAQNYKLPLTTEILSDSVSDDYELALEITRPICENCLAEAKISWGVISP